MGDRRPHGFSNRLLPSGATRYRLRVLPRRVRVLTLLLAVAAGGAIAPSSAGAALYGTQGLAGGEGLGARLDFAKRAGSQVVRISAAWQDLEPSAQGQRDPAAVAALDELVAGAAARGMRTVLVLTGTPCWASTAPAELRGDCRGPDANRSAVTRYKPADPRSAVPIATFLAGRYADRLAAFQIWNEPDQANEKYWAGPNKVATYVALVKTLYGPLKQAAPNVPVLAGSFVGKDGRWLKAMYAAGAKGSYDGLAVQFYGPTLYGLRNTRAVQLFHGDRTPLWLTEFGVTDCYRRGGPALQLDQKCVSPAAAAQGITDILTAVRTRPWIAATIQYELYDGAPGGYTFGLADRNGRAKGTYRAVRRALTGQVRRPKRPTLRLRRSGRSTVVSGTASVAERLNLRVEKNGQTRLKGAILPDATGRFRLVLPPELGTRGLRVRLYAGWTGSRVARR